MGDSAAAICPVRNEDAAYPSLLGLNYTDMLGCYAFMLTQTARGELRPLRGLGTADDGGGLGLLAPLLLEPKADPERVDCRSE